MSRITLKVDVDTLRGTREGVPALQQLLDRHQARATFLFSLGPDNTGRALRRVFRPGFLKKVSRTSVVEHYGLKTLSYGVLLPGPDIGKKAAAEMRAIANAGHECGIHTWDHVEWHDQVRHRDAAWTLQRMQQSYDRFGEIFGHAPATHGAAGWQMNETAIRQLDAWGMQYASDGRGSAPYFISFHGQPCQHMQLPTTLPTLDEILGVDGLNVNNVHEHLLGLTDPSRHGPRDHVFTLHAELEGQKLLPIFDRLLAGWHTQGHVLGTMGDYHATLTQQMLPVHPFAWGEIPGRSGELIVDLPVGPASL